MGGLGSAFAPEKTGGLGNQGNGAVRRDRDEFGKEVVFTRKVRDRRNAVATVAVARSAETGRQPIRHQIFVGEIGGCGIDDRGAGIDAGLDRIRLYELLAEAVNGLQVISSKDAAALAIAVR
jgi:hypothetical protein